MAAGLGSRFGAMTETMPKGFIEAGGVPMVVRSVETLLDCGIERIIIGTGYKREAYEALARRYPQIECVYSPRYAQTNSMWTLWNCRQAVGGDDFLLLESDLIYSPSAITALADSPYADAMLITPVRKFQDQYYVEADAGGILTRCSTQKDEVQAQGELVGIHRLSNAFYRRMCSEYAKIADGQPKLGYEYQLLWMSNNASPVHVVCRDDVQWYEIDDEDDLRYAEENIINNLEYRTK